MAWVQAGIVHNRKDSFKCGRDAALKLKARLRAYSPWLAEGSGDEVSESRDTYVHKSTRNRCVSGQYWRLWLKSKASAFSVYSRRFPIFDFKTSLTSDGLAKKNSFLEFAWFSLRFAK